MLIFFKEMNRTLGADIFLHKWNELMHFSTLFSVTRRSRELLKSNDCRRIPEEPSCCNQVNPDVKLKYIHLFFSRHTSWCFLNMILGTIEAKLKSNSVKEKLRGALKRNFIDIRIKTGQNHNLSCNKCF